MADVKETLYAWANPLDETPIFDHTWVTNYNVPPIHDNPPPPPQEDNYWWCWGDYHPDGSGGTGHHPHGAIGNAEASSADIVADIVPPNNHTAYGTITYYAIDGVCHNVANQTLYATGDTNNYPLRVTEAKGYSLSNFFYGNYGLQNEAWENIVAQYAPTVKTPTDDFTTIRKSILPNLPATEIAKIDATRSAAQTALQSLRDGIKGKEVPKIYAEIVAILSLALYALYHILGKEDFELLFPPFDNIIDGKWIHFGMLEKCVKELV